MEGVGLVRGRGRGRHSGGCGLGVRESTLHCMGVVVSCAFGLCEQLSDGQCVLSCSDHERKSYKQTQAVTKAELASMQTALKTMYVSYKH